MSVIALLTNRIPGATIQSALENAEFQQIIDLLAGTSTSKNIVVKYSHATDAPVAVDQLGAGIIQEWKLSGTRKAHVTNNGSISTVNQLISTLASGGVPPMLITSTTKVDNLNADLLDGQEGAYYLSNANATGVLSGALGGTGVANSGKTITLGGSVAFSGGNDVQFNSTGSTSVTLPTTGTLATLAGSETLTNKTLTAPIIATISNSGTITIPTGTLTLATLTGTETFTNKTLTSPRIGTSMLDTNGNELFNLTATGSAVNELTYANAATGSGPSFTASGGDTDIPVTVNAKGAGVVTLNTYARHDSLGRILTRAGNGSTPSSDEIALSGMYATGVPATAPGSGTVTTTLKTVAANVMGKDGDYLEIWVSGTSSGANNKEVILNINGSDVVTTTTYTGADQWWIHAFLRRDTSSNMDCFGTILRNGFANQRVGELFSSSFNFAATFTVNVKTVLTTSGQVSINRYAIIKHTTPA